MVISLSVCTCVRCGEIFDAAFIAYMCSFAQRADLSDKTQTLLTVMHGEAMLGCLEMTKSRRLVCTERPLPDDDTEDVSAAKRLCRSSSSQMLDNTTKPFDVGSDSHDMQDTSTGSSTFNAKNTETLMPVARTPCCHVPMFYYCFHRRHLKNVNLPK